MPEVLESEGPAHRGDVPLESLKNRISLTDMGSRLVRDAFHLPSQQKPGTQAPGKNSTAFDELLSFVFKYFSDLPDDVIAAAAESLSAIMHSRSLSETAKKSEAETILGEELSNSAFNELFSMIQRLPAPVEGNLSSLEEDDGDEMEGLNEFLDNLSNDEDDNESQDAATNAHEQSDSGFVAINDPIRLHDKSLVRPQDVDAHWLENQLKDIDLPGVELNDILGVLNAANSDTEAELLAMLGVENTGLVQVLLKNADVIFWYTRLNRSETGAERERMIDEIHKRGLSIEALAEKELDAQMQLEAPEKVDLHATGRPLSVAAVPNVKLPEGSTKYTTESYEQYNIPAMPVAEPDWPLKAVSDLPEWAQPAFARVEKLNFVQSRSCDAVVDSDVNILLCAPTGAGKTNVAVLALAGCLHHSFKAVYVAPLKALVQEQVRTLQARFPSYSVAELSGDQSLSRDQLLSTDVLVATPEKWDSVSRKPANSGLLRSVGLVVIDEIHLLHDERRGSVLENIVARHTRSLYAPRLVGLSATLPNYKDVARFLNVPSSGLLFFDAKFRPIPLEQKYLGVTAKSPLKLMKGINDACAEKVSEALREGKQVLVFVHSRKDTKATASFLVGHEATSDLLAADQVAVHHAGLRRDERALAESEFVDRKLKVLVCTATLAWGVNLPAAVVVIKGTQFYDPSSEGWRQLQPQDVLQMLGRAGRPGFDTSGLGVILTEHKYLSYFASIATMALPIESHLINRLLESVNAEVCLGTVRSLDEAVQWLECTFWHVRSSNDPDLYGLSRISPVQIAHTALFELAQLGAVVYDYPAVRATFQGKIASNFYVSPTSVNLFCRQMKPWLTEIDLIRVFCLSAEFATLPIRRGEEAEIKRLSSMAPIPVRDVSSSRVAKVCVLLQAYISRLQLDGLAISADMVYIAQSASRLFRAIYELAVAQRWGRLALVALRLYISVDKRQWFAGQTPFRQFSGCPLELINRAEASQLPWKRYFDLDTGDIGDALRLQSAQLANLAVQYLDWFPRFSLSAKAQPLTRTVLLITLEITPLFAFDSEVHRPSEIFYLQVEDQSGTLLDCKLLRLSELRQHTTKHAIAFLPSEAYSPCLFARVVSDRWLHAEYSVAVSLRSLLPPAKFSAPLDLGFETNVDSSFENGLQLGPLQRALLSLLYRSDRSTFVGLPAGSDALSCQEMVIRRAMESSEKVLLLTPRNVQWTVALFNSRPRPFAISTDLDSDADVFVVSAAEAERISQVETRFQRVFGKFGVVICDDLHRIDAADRHTGGGPAYELALTRIVDGGLNVRVVGFGFTVATARAVGQWIGAQKNDVANIALSDGLGELAIEVRHWERSIVFALRTLALSLSSSLLLVVEDVRQSAALVEELAYIGHEDVNVLTSLSSLQLDGNAHHCQSLTVATLDLVLKVRTLRADKIALFGTQQRSPDGGSSDVSAVDVLELVSRSSSEVVIYTDRQQFYATFVKEPLPLESALVASLSDAVAVEVARGKIRGPQDAVDWLSGTYLYRRLRQNPSFYGSGDLEEWISEVVESEFEKLARLGVVELQEETLDVAPLAPAHIAAHYGASVSSLVDPQSHSIVLRKWSLYPDENCQSLRTLDARIDLAAAQGNLTMLFTAVDTRQSLTQSVPLGASPLCQIPYIDDRAALKCQDAGINSVQEFVAIEDDELRSSILGFNNDDGRMIEVAEFVNHFPIVDIARAKVSDASATVVVERDMEDENDVRVVAQGLPGKLSKEENWFVVVGDPQTRALYGFKRTKIAVPELQVQIPLTYVSQNMTVWLMCDSYIDADKELEVSN